MKFLVEDRTKKIQPMTEAIELSPICREFCIFVVFIQTVHSLNIRINLKKKLLMPLLLLKISFFLTFVCIFIYDNCVPQINYHSVQSVLITQNIDNNLKSI